jgi:HlyD family secretion protein
MIKHVNNILLLITATLLSSCRNETGDIDASGTFEAEEIIVSSETAGRILSMKATEGARLDSGEIAVLVDTTSLLLQSEQLDASIGALSEKQADVVPVVRTLEQQIRVQETQLDALERERNRIANLQKADAATTRQLDDAETQVRVAKEQLALTRRQLEQQKSAIGTQNRSVMSEQAPLEKRKAILSDQLSRSQVRNPVKGTVLAEYTRAGEMTAPGKALYKIANLDEMVLRAYLDGEDYASVKLEQQVKILVDDPEKGSREYTGTLSWLSDKAEFTPKTIMTKDERSNLVYAVKVRVKNDGTLKIGMYADLKL